MALSPILSTPRGDVAAPADASGVWRHAFPSAELVESAVALFTGARLDEREVPGVTLGGVPLETIRLDGERQLAPSVLKGFELHGDPREGQRRDRELVEGPRWRVMVSPGTVAVRFSDPARAERTAQRRIDWTVGRCVCGRFSGCDCRSRPVVTRDENDQNRNSGITSWSARSRSRMVETMAALDWSEMFQGDEIPAMVTLTMQGGHRVGCWESAGGWDCGTAGCRWLDSAPNAAASRRHLLLWRKRFEREFGVRLRGVWKREFQRRGAPHFHILMVPPTELGRSGLSFRDWLGPTWAAVVADPDLEVRKVHAERGTGIDFAAGVKARDPRSIGVYFSKHGAFADKEYQNVAPVEWVEGGSVGRFWGVWGLERATAAVEVSAREAIAAKRTLRRLSRANSYQTRVPVWRYRTYVDEDGQERAKWRRSTKKTRVYRVKGQAGYLVVRDGPAVAAALARHLDQLVRPEAVMKPSGAGPRGFLP